MPLVCTGGLCEYVPGGNKSRNNNRRRSAPGELLTESSSRSINVDENEDDYHENNDDGHEDEEGSTSHHEDEAVVHHDDSIPWDIMIKESGIFSSSSSEPKSDSGAEDTKSVEEDDNDGQSSNASTSAESATNTGFSGFVVYNPTIVQYVTVLNNCCSSTTTTQSGSSSDIYKVIDVLNKLIKYVEPATDNQGESRGHGPSNTVAFHGGIQAITKCMKVYNKHSKVQQKSCRLLGLLSEDEPDLQDKISNEFGVLCILGALTTFKGIKLGVHKEGCYALSHLLEYPENVQHFTMSRGLHNVVSSIKQFPKSKDVQLYGTTCLRLLASTSASAIDYPSVVHACMISFKAYPKCLQIQTNDLLLLYVLAKGGSQETQEAIMSHDEYIVPWILKLLEEHLCNEVIQCLGCGILYYLALRHFDARTTMVKQGTISLLWKSMKEHSCEHPHLIKEATKLLQLLSKGPSLQSPTSATTMSASLPTFELTEQPQSLRKECY